MEQSLTTEGIIFLIFGWGFVFSLTGYCIYKVLRTGKKLEQSEQEK